MMKAQTKRVPVAARRRATSPFCARATALVAAAVLLMSQASAASAPTPQGGRDGGVSDSILGVKVGMTLEEVHEKLKPLGTFGGRGTREGGRKEAWTLKKTDFSSVAYQTDGRGRVKWVTGFVRPGKEIRFEKLGDLSRATKNTEQEAVWNVERAEGNYRLMAKGAGGRAQVIQILWVTLPAK
jgi:hypothetical protein